MDTRLVWSAPRRFPLPGLLWLAGGALLLGLARLLPADGLGVAVRLAVASALVLILPGALVVARLGVPAGVGAFVAAAVAWSLAMLFAALVLTFLVGGSLTMTLVLVGSAALGVAVIPIRKQASRPHRDGALAAAAVAVVGALYGVVVWFAAGPLRGDALFHAARARKLTELPALDSLRVVSEFPDGGVHPGYAVPLWHGVLALVGRLAGLDVTDVVLHLSAVLTPLALVLAYAAGAALFGSRAGGVATAAAQAGLVELAGEHVTSFKLLSLPVAASLLVLVPAVLALVFSFVATAERRALVSVGAAALALAVVHPTYVVFLMLPLAGFLAARAALARGSGEAVRIGLALGAIVAPAGAYLLWLLPVASDAASYTPGERRRAQELVYYADRLDFADGAFRLDPGLLVSPGFIAVTALIVVALAPLAWRSRWAAYVLGGSLPVLAVALVPELFSRLADLVSLSQALRLRHFVPLPFALAGAALLLSAGMTGLAARARLRPGIPAGTVAVGLVLALVLPVVAARAAALETGSDSDPLPAGLVDVVRAGTQPRELVVSDPVTSYRLAAYAPITIIAAPLAHVAQTPQDRPYERLREIERFVAAGESERRRLLAAYGGWLLVDRQWAGGDLSVSGLKTVYDDGRFVLLRVGTR